MINLFAQFPAWTNVMRKYFSSSNTISTSASSECYYRIMRRDYQMNCPITINRFLLSHLDHINGATKLGRTTIKKWKQHRDDANINGFKHTIKLPEIVPQKLEEKSGRTTEKNVTLHNINCSMTKSKYKVDLCTSSSSEENKVFTNLELVKRNMLNIGVDYTVAYYDSIEIPDNIFSMKNQKERHILWSNDLQTLRLHEYVCGSVIDSFMMLNSISNWKNVSFVPTEQTNYILGYSSNCSKSKNWLMYNLNFVFTGLVFLPYCYNSHRCLLVLNVEERTIIHLDSMDIKDTTGDRAIEAFLRYLKECQLHKVNNLCYLNWDRKYLPIDRPIQTDGNNCGIFIMFYMNRLAKGKLLKTTVFNANVYRNTIAKNLIKYSKDVKKICLYCENQHGNHKNAYLTCKNCNRWAHLRCILRVLENNQQINEDTLITIHICRICNVH